tara:strand:+ start:1353 stop:1763 length:411 start_codon:yes stop_codon:yes gene_type:complete
MIDTIKENKIDLLFRVTESISGAKRKDIVGKKRYKELIVPRHIVGYMLHKELDINLINSGKIINRDHSTICHYVKTYDDNMGFFKEYKEMYNLIADTYWSQIMDADVEDISLEVKNLQNLIDTLTEKKNKLIKLTN